MYDQEILKHYAQVSKQEGHLESCTMADQKIREIESKFILDGIKSFIAGNSTENIKLLDVGCGNGFTLDLVHREFPKIQISGIEYTPELRGLANKKGLPIEILPGDVRVASTMPSKQDVIISQRVLINLLDKEDQKKALRNIINSLRVGGFLIIIEAFSSGLDNLNKCRVELGLSQISPAEHNLYFEDDFFTVNNNITAVSTAMGVNVLSTHYFVSRVLHDLALAATNSNFVRNSLFARFFDEALPLGIGQFSPLKCHIFKKI